MDGARSRRIDQVSAAGALVGLASLAFAYVQVRPNRVAQGTPLYLWQVATLPETVLYLLLLALAVGLALGLDRMLVARRRAGRGSFPGGPSSGAGAARATLLGLAGDLLVAAAFVVCGANSARLLPAGSDLARVSFAPGLWMAALSGYILISSAPKRAALPRAARIAVTWGWLPLVAAAAAAGWFGELSLVREYLARSDRFAAQLGYHLALSFSATAVAIALGMPFGVLAYRRRVAARPIFAVVNTVQTIPSLALFGLLIAPLSALSHALPALREVGISGIGAAPAFVALTLYALLPITRNTFTGLRVLPPGVIEAGRGMGMGRSQLLFRVELPLALPVIASGIRISLVQAVGNTTVAALIGAGGFGVFIFQGLGQAAPDLILLGTLPVIVLAVGIDRAMAALERLLLARQQ